MLYYLLNVLNYCILKVIVVIYIYFYFEELSYKYGGFGSIAKLCELINKIEFAYFFK